MAFCHLSNIYLLTELTVLNLFWVAVMNGSVYQLLHGNAVRLWQTLIVAADFNLLAVLKYLLEVITVAWYFGLQ